MLDKDFFSRYNDVHGKDKDSEGIPGLKMNSPIAVSQHKGRIGLELEIEARNETPNEGRLDAVVAPTTKAKWTTVRDGSLRGDYAREYIVTHPINRDELRPMLEGLFEVFKEMKTKLNNSNRCSTHVHLNMGGKKINEITAVMCLWTIFEQSLINFCGEERQSNHFALSSAESNATLVAWEEYLRYGHGNWERNLKYQAMNVLPLFDKGSLEIRCGAAADDAEGPIVWATLLDHLVDFAIERYSKGIPLIGSDLSERGGASLFEELCSRDSILSSVYTKVMADSGGTSLFNDSCLRGFRNCQPIVYGFPWEAWHKMIEKEFVPDPFAKPAGGRKFRPAPPARPIRINPIPPIERAAEIGAMERIFERDREQMRNMNVAQHAERIAGLAGLEERRYQAGDRVRYIQGTMRPHGSLGTVDRVEGDGMRIYVQWDDEDRRLPHELRFCSRRQIELAREGDIPPGWAVENEVNEEEEVPDEWAVEVEDDDDNF